MIKNLKFKTFHTLSEATEAAMSANAKNNRNGVMHEILTGYHLNNQTHMPNHPNKNGESAQEAHDKMKATMSKKEYDHAHNKAKAAANKLKEHIKKNHPGNKIHTIHWTSKPGDLHSSTGIHASQKQDSSDICITTKHHDGTKRHHGVSLKNTDKSSVNIGTSNHGHETMHPTSEQEHKDHHDAIHKLAPELKKNKRGEAYSSAAKRKEWAKNNPKKHEKIKALNKGFLTSQAKKHAEHLTSKLKSGKKEDHDHVKQHIRDVLAAKKTPMQKHGHEHIRLTSTVFKGEHKNHISHPGDDHEHVLNDPHFHKNVTIHHTGTGHVIKHKGKPIASFTYKFNSQSDPKSSLAAVGNTKKKMKNGEVVPH